MEQYSRGKCIRKVKWSLEFAVGYIIDLINSTQHALTIPCPTCLMAFYCAFVTSIMV